MKRQVVSDLIGNSGTTALSNSKSSRSPGASSDSESASLIHELHHMGAPGERGTWKEQLIDNTRSPIPDQAAFRIDFPTWLDELSERDRLVALQLANGERTTDVARRLGVTLGRVSQIRRALHEGWLEFHGDDECVEVPSAKKENRALAASA